MKRRDFIHKTAATASVFSIVPSHVLGFGKTAPNDKIQLGFIGRETGKRLDDQFCEL